MDIRLNPSAAVQSGLTLVTALTCVDALRLVPDYLSGRIEASAFWIRVMIAIIMVCIALIIMFNASYKHSIPLDKKNDTNSADNDDTDSIDSDE